MNVRNFVNDMFGELKVFLDENGEVWFYGVEVAKTLGFGDPATTISRLDADERLVLEYKRCKASGTEEFGMLWTDPKDFRPKALISEAGLYGLIMKSRIPSAKSFQRWVTHEVLPSIRKNGGYIEGEEDLVKEDRAKVDEEIRNLRSKVAYLQKRRHELLSEQRKNRKTISGLNDYADLYEELYDKLVRENAELTQQIFDLRFPDARERKEHEPEPKHRYVVTDAEGFVVGVYER